MHCCGPNRIRLSILMPIQIRIRSLSQGRKSEISNASLLCFIFLISVIGVILFITLDSVFKFSGKQHSLSLHLIEMDTDPDPFRQALDDDPVPDRQNYVDLTGSGSSFEYGSTTLD
jgi:hypothetical protein